MEDLLTINDFQLSGRVEPCYENGACLFHPAGEKGRHHLAAWLSHLFLCANSGPGIPSQSFLFLRNKIFRLNKVGNAESILGELLNLYWKGLHEPLPFFPESAWVYASQLRKKPDDEAFAREKALGRWLSETDRPAEGDECLDPYFGLAFRNCDPFANTDFFLYARRVYGPLLDCEEEIRNA